MDVVLDYAGMALRAMAYVLQFCGIVLAACIVGTRRD